MQSGTIAISSQVIAAVRNNDAGNLSMLLARGQNQDTLDTCLCWAARKGHLCCVMMLMEAGANPNADTWGGFTALLWATLGCGDIDIVHYLIQNGADVNRFSYKQKQTALHAAVIKGDAELAECLINAGAALDMQDFLHRTPLLHAVKQNLFACTKLLIQRNCNVNLTGLVNGWDLAPVVVALMQNNLEIVQMLILAGARFEPTAIYHTFTYTQYYHTVEDKLNLELRPVYLKQQCRVCIRDLLRPDFLEKLKHIVLPASLREFLMMGDLDCIA